MGATTLAPQAPTRALELADIQGIIRRGYENLKATRFLLLRFTEDARAGAWLKALADQLNDSTKKPTADHTAINVAFTHAGLLRLGLADHLVENLGLAHPFEEGMPRRLEILGDHGLSDPSCWSWGAPKGEEIHAILMLYAGDARSLDALVDRQLRAANLHGVVGLGHRLDGVELPGRKEHFGFRDGIAQPMVAGLDDGSIPPELAAESTRILQEGSFNGNLVAPGEFILGYPNVYGKAGHSPAVAPESDPEGHLRPHPEQGRDLGRNGSYMVFRQLRQDVKGFWSYVDEMAGRTEGADRRAARERLAAKMVGRWRDGCPITKARAKSDPTLQDDNDFGYFDQDKWGHGCPVGSHVRRSNPRDCTDPDAETSEEALRSVAAHRIIRRGRPYGSPIAPSMEPDDILRAPASTESAGLQFICFNADISRQFEFIQNTWLINPKFGGLYGDGDPLVGDANPKAVQRGLFGDFVAPEDPYRERKSGLQRFVQVEGGAYFFMPGISAVRYLAALTPSAP